MVQLQSTINTKTNIKDAKNMAMKLFLTFLGFILTLFFSPGTHFLSINTQNVYKNLDQK
jgi:hypothetical protein